MIDAIMERVVPPPVRQPNGAGGKDAVPQEDIAARLAERDVRLARAAARPPDPNRDILGDPPPGRSALDRRR